MIAVVQRILDGSITTDSGTICAVGHGLCALVAIERDDDRHDIDWMVRKLLTLRLFDDGDGRWARTLTDVDGDLLLVSNFTVAGRCRKGTRPDFSRSAAPGPARLQFELLAEALAARYPRVATGVFGADMQVALVNDGPVTVILESRKDTP
ncbi:MAG: D-tyrosyl-tRNA(Tyr) deacylase [Candidatus Dadabacteria bacterium]|nr:MAG: D-tyrosyl-tRNA(Tyr) deacylase [Candidatus Dadabacteria bacterium]